MSKSIITKGLWGKRNVCVSQSITKKDFGAKGLYNLANAGGTWTLRGFHLGVILFHFQITFPDFHMYELLDQHRILEPKCLDKFPKLQAFQDRIEVRWKWNEKGDIKVEKHLLVAEVKLKMWEKQFSIFNFSSATRSHFSNVSVLFTCIGTLRQKDYWKMVLGSIN